jgi:DNA-binding protein HU-beta
MNKTEMISKIAEKTGYTKKDTTIVVDTLCEVIRDAVVAGDKVAIAGFGTFDVSERKERQGINPKTKEAITIPSSKSPKFKAASAFKSALNS